MRIKKDPPPSVRFAQSLGDHSALSRLERKGAMTRKEFAAKDRERKIQSMLYSYFQMAREANEDICPIN